MPVYTLKDLKNGDQWDVVCSWEELQVTLNEMPNIKQVLAAPKIVGGRSGGQGSKVPDGFKDLQKRIKEGSGRGNTINV